VLGQVISHYEIVGKIGAGGMGEVFEARDTLLHRTVALKVLPAGKVADPERRARFLTEARTASSLNHPFIVTIHDVVTTDDGAFCLVMERVRGRPLSEAIPAGGLPLETVLRFARQGADALAAAHAAGIVHRDLKPGNVMVTDRGDIKVLDFGLAKLMPGAASAPDPTITSGGTQLGALLGTPDYMSPEQAKGEPVDHRTDIFSFGMLVFEMLSGRRPFGGADRIAALHALVSQPAPRVSAMRAGLPASIDRLVDRLLAKDRAERYQSFADVLDDLRRIEAGESVSPAPRPATPAERAIGRRGRSFGLAGLAVAAVLVGGFLIVSPRWRGAGEPTAAEAPLPVTAADFVRQGDRLLQRYDRDGHVDQAMTAYQSAVGLQPDHAPAFSGLAIANWRRFRETRDRIWLEHAEGNARQAIQRDPLLASGHAALGLALTAGGALDDAATSLAEALKLDPTNADAIRGLGDLAARDRRFDEAERHYVAAIAARPDDPELPGVLGGLYYRLGRTDEASSAFERAVALADDNYIAHKNLGAVRHMQGRFADAAGSLQRAVELKPEASVYTNLGTLYYYQGLYPQAITALERSLALRANDFRTWGNLGDALRRTADGGARAVESYRRAVQLASAEMEAAPTADTRALRALYRARAGDHDDARSDLEQLAGIKELAAESLYVKALAREALGERAAAVETLRLAIGAGHSVDELERDPELTELRADPAYHRMMARQGSGGSD
jgi:eukaryotic-like serine/threonine-protein kinase